MINYDYNMKMLFEFNELLIDVDIYINRRKAGATITKEETNELATRIVRSEVAYADPWEETEAVEEVAASLEKDPEAYYTALVDVLQELIEQIKYEYNKENGNND